MASRTALPVYRLPSIWENLRSRSPKPKVRILREDEPDLLAALDRAWSRPETLVVLPEKGGPDDSLVASAGAALPPQLRTGCFALATSGSTGRPKLVFGGRERAERLAALLHEVQESDPVAQTILALPLSYCYAFVNQWLWSRCAGRQLVPTGGLGRPETLRRALERAEDAMLCLVGAQLPLLERAFAGAAFPGVIRLHFAGGRFPQEALGRIRRLFPAARVYNNYGCAEALPRLTVRAAEDGASAGDVGRPLPGVELSVDEQGELRFRSPFGALAVADGGGGLRLVAEDEWLATGDCAELRPDGAVQLHGREDQVFKRYGEKVAPARILDLVAGAWPGEAHFYRERDRQDEEGYVLVLAPAPAEDELRELLATFRAREPRTCWPLRVESLPRLPVLPSGKVDARGLSGAPDRAVHWRNRI